MNCPNCNQEVQNDVSFCPFCGKYLKDHPDYNLNPVIKENDYNPQPKPVLIKKSNKKNSNTLISLIFIFIWGLSIYFIVNNITDNYYFEGETEITVTEPNGGGNTTVDPEPEPQPQPITPQNPNVVGVTKIVYNHKYNNLSNLKSELDVRNLIVNDSTNQKGDCPQDVKKIENEIINRYNITAVNLCELDLDFAIELENVVDYIYNNYPTARGYLTNITLANIDDSSSFMAAFMPLYTFATSNTSSRYPIGTKSMIILNAKYFLNTPKISNSVEYGSSSGYFPKNATRSSTVAHEFGHYLSYVAMLNHYGQGGFTYTTATRSTPLVNVNNDFIDGNFSYRIINEGYEAYIKDTGKNISFDDFRASISKYAIAKDGTGAYIYDETVAEAFHDVYLNHEDCAPASRYIFKSLIKYL